MPRRPLFPSTIPNMYDSRIRAPPAGENAEISTLILLIWCSRTWTGPKLSEKKDRRKSTRSSKRNQTTTFVSDVLPLSLSKETLPWDLKRGIQMLLPKVVRARSTSAEDTSMNCPRNSEYEKKKVETVRSVTISKAKSILKYSENSYI